MKIPEIRWFYVAILMATVLVCAIANNLRAPEKDQVSWIGGQEVLAKPEDIQ